MTPAISVAAADWTSRRHEAMTSPAISVGGPTRRYRGLLGRIGAGQSALLRIIAR
jgi:ABC-type sulfate/molybdate transport systems ATPase subunit